MKRKVIKHGPSTLIVSLPAEWAKQNNIQSGTHLEVEKNGKSIIFSTKAIKKDTTIKINIDDLDRTTIILLIRNLYRRGHTLIELSYKNPTTMHFRTGREVNVLSAIHEEVNRLIGMEVIEQSPKHCVIKEIIQSSENDFDILFRKVFMQVQSAFDDLVSALNQRDMLALENIEQEHDTVAKFVSYCIRILNMGRISSDTIPQKYHLLISCDLIMDNLKYFVRDYKDADHELEEKSKQTISKMAEMFRIYCRIHFNQNIRLMNQYQKLRDDAKNSIGKTNDADRPYLNYLSSLLEVSRMMAETTLSICH